MRARLTILYNPSCPQETQEIDDMRHASDFKMIIWDIQQKLREIEKHGDHSKLTAYDVIDEVNQLIREELTSKGLTLE